VFISGRMRKAMRTRIANLEFLPKKFKDHVTDKPGNDCDTEIRWRENIMDGEGQRPSLGI